MHNQDHVFADIKKKLCNAANAGNYKMMICNMSYG